MPSHGLDVFVVLLAVFGHLLVRVQPDTLLIHLLDEDLGKTVFLSRAERRALVGRHSRYWLIQRGDMGVGVVCREEVPGR